MTKDEELITLRQEVAALRQENATLREELAQVKAHLQAVQEQQAKDSHNSSLPPSSDRFIPRTKSLRQKSGKKPGGQKGHPGHHLMRVELPDEIVVHPVEHCGSCGADLAKQPASCPESRQVFDVPAKRLWVVEHRVQEKCCPHCGTFTRATFPTALKAPAQYGEGLAALAVYLVEGHFVPYARATELLHDWFGVQMSAGSLVSFVKQCHQHLAEVHQRLKEAVSRVEVLHHDETGMRVNTQTRWVLVACTQKLTHYAAHRQHGRDAMKEIGICSAFEGILMHDGLMSYQAFDCQHALCNAHHLRELTFVHEHFHQEWALDMKKLLLKMKQRVQEAKARGLTHLDPLTLRALSADYDHFIAEGWRVNTSRAQAPPEKVVLKGKVPRKQSPPCKLLHRLQVGKAQALAFLYDFRVPFDNNQAERDLRMLKVQQKITGGLRTDLGLQMVCRIRSYLSTLRKQKGDLLEALHQTLLGHPVLPAF